MKSFGVYRCILKKETILLDISQVSEVVPSGMLLNTSNSMPNMNMAK